jgi:peptidoglycan/xylan/chitin deacetylase (PgdA/CDA1 family)
MGVFDAVKNLAVTAVATAPSPAASGTTLTVTASTGGALPAVPFYATVFPTGATPTLLNAEIVRVTAVSGDTVTVMTRAQGGTSARTIVVGDVFSASLTAEMFRAVQQATKQQWGWQPNLLGAPRIVSRFQSGHGFTATNHNSGSSNLNDTTDTVFGTQSAKIVTAGNSAFVTLRKDASAAVDLSSSLVRVWVKLDNPSALSYVTLYGGTTGMTKYASWSIAVPPYTTGMSPVPAGKWVPIGLTLADATLTGAPDITAITDWQVAMGDTGTAATVWVGAIEVYPHGSGRFPRGVVTICLDDTFASQWTRAKPVLDQYGFRATMFPIIGRVGAGGSLTLAQLQTMALEGWEVAPHAFTDTTHAGFASMTSRAISEDVLNCQEWLWDNGFRDYGSYAYPLGFYNGPDDIIAPYRGAARTIEFTDQHDSLPPSNPLWLRSVPGVGGVGGNSVANVLAILDKAVTYGTWVTLTLHDITAGAATVANECSLADFTTLIAGISSRGMAVATMGEVMGWSSNFGGPTRLGGNAVGWPVLAETTGKPAVPTSGTTLFTRPRAGRRALAIAGPTGETSELQASIARANIGLWQPQGNATTAPGVLGFAAVSAIGTATTRTVAVTSKATRLRRIGYPSAATAGSLGGARTTLTQHSAGSGSDDGSGVFFVERWVESDPATVAGRRSFTGFASSTSAPTNVEPDTLTNVIGVGQISTDATQWYWLQGGSAAQAKVACGTALGAPGGNSATAWELVIFAPPLTANTFYLQLTNLTTGAFVTRTMAGAATVVPQSSTLLAWQHWVCNNATALAVGMDLASLYYETFS